MILEWLFRVLGWISEQNDGLTAVAVLIVGVMALAGTLLVGVMTMVGALATAAAALIGVSTSAGAANKRSEDALASAAIDRQMNADQQKEMMELNRDQQRVQDLREQKASRQSRLTTATEQLGSDIQAVRIGGLHSLSALADEWDQEARELLGVTLTLKEISEIPEVTHRIDPLDRRYASPVAQSTLAQRDVSIGLICAYLRGAPIGLTLRDDSPVLDMPLQEFTFSPRTSDWDARTMAFETITEHIDAGSLTPWPGYLIQLDGAELSGYRFVGCNLVETSFKGANMNNVYMHSCNIVNAKFNGANLKKANILKSNFADSSFTGACFMGAHIYSSDFTNVDFTDSDLRGVSIHRSDLRKCPLHSSKMDGAYLITTKFGKDWEDSIVPHKLLEKNIPSWNNKTKWSAEINPQDILDIAVEHKLITPEEAVLWTQRKF